MRHRPLAASSSSPLSGEGEEVRVYMERRGKKIQRPREPGAVCHNANPGKTRDPCKIAGRYV